MRNMNQSADFCIANNQKFEAIAEWNRFCRNFTDIFRKFGKLF